MNYSRLEDFYLAVAIATLMHSKRSNPFPAPQHGRTAVMFKSLGVRCIPYIKQVNLLICHIVRCSLMLNFLVFVYYSLTGCPQFCECRSVYSPNRYSYQDFSSIKLLHQFVFVGKKWPTSFDIVIEAPYSSDHRENKFVSPAPCKKMPWMIIISDQR